MQSFLGAKRFKKSENKINEKSSSYRLGINKKNDKTSLVDATQNDGSEYPEYDLNTKFSTNKKRIKITLNY